MKKWMRDEFWNTDTTFSCCFGCHWGTKQKTEKIHSHQNASCLWKHSHILMLGQDPFRSQCDTKARSSLLIVGFSIQEHLLWATSVDGNPETKLQVLCHGVRRCCSTSFCWNPSLLYKKKCKNQQKSARGGWRYSGSISLIKDQVIFCEDLETVIALVKYKILTQTLFLNFYFTNNSYLSRILKIHPFTTWAVRFSNHFVSFLVRLQWQWQQSAFGCSLKASEKIYRSALQNKK